MRWQRRARFAVAAFGLAFAGVVYLAIGERQAAAPLLRPTRLDPRAILESAGAVFRQFSAVQQDYVIEAERQMLYEGGATKLIGVTIKVREKAGRDFIVSGREAQAGENQQELEITGEVKLIASDGFVVSADRATFNQTDGIVRVPGPVSFQKGRMSGSGVGMTYDKNTDVLILAEQASVIVKDEGDNVQMEFASGTATLARQDNYLALQGSVHALRGEQVIEADQATARLTENEEFITFIELRGSSRVSGGGTFDSMSARDIDLDYTEDGATLERVVLTGQGAIAMTGQNGAAGRQFVGDTLDLTFAPDASLTRVLGRGNVRVDLPVAANSPARSVKARTFTATGAPGKGLTSSQFTDDVEYREEIRGGAAPRIARSRGLQITLANDVVTTAVFTGSVRFEDQGLQASAANAQYDPARGTLHLSGTDAGGGPRVADEQINIEAGIIDVTLQGRQMTAAGSVKTTLRAAQAASREGGRIPGLLQQNQAVNVNADSLDYQGGTAKAVYTGQATLWQGETAIRGDVVTLDQTNGNLLASGKIAGNARSTLVFDTGISIGRATEIRYDDATRTVTYNTPGRPPRSSAPLPPGPPLPQSQLSGPQGEMRADRFELILAQEGGQLEKLEAYTQVSLRTGMRVATAEHLTYHTADDRYVLSGIPTVPVSVVEGCRETIGRTVTFFKSTDRVIVDGNEEARTQSRRGVGPCPQQPPPAR